MQEEMKLQDYVRIMLNQIFKNKFLIAAVSLLCFLIGILFASWQTVTNTYFAQATVYTVVGESTQEMSLTTTAFEGYADVVTSQKVCNRAESILGDPGISAESIQGMVSTSYNKTSTVMTITAYSTNPATAVKVSNAVADAFVVEMQSLTGNDRIQVLDTATNVHMSSNGMKSLLKTIILFGIAGFMGSIVVIAASVLFSTKVRSVEQCLDEGEDEILGIVPFTEEL